MQAYISALNFVDKIGRLHSSTTAQDCWMFSTKALADPEDFAQLFVGCEVSFELEQGKVRQLQPAALRDSAEVARYQLPDAVSFETSHLREGYEILDVGRLQLSRMNRDVHKARAELSSLCRSLGGNTLLEVTERQEQRTAMGYAFIYHHVSGFAAVAGRPDERGAVDASDLLQSLNHREISRRGKQHETKAASKLVFKIVGGVLLALFCAGYIYTTWLQ